MSQYQLPCEHCGEVIPITATMAGSRVTCQSCETVQAVPKMGVIRNLAQVSGSESVKATRGKLSSQQLSKQRWSPTQGFLFAAGFVLLIAGLLGFGLSYQKYSKYKNDYDAGVKILFSDGQLPDFTNLQFWENNIARLPVGDLWEEWRDALRETLSDWNPTGLQDLREKMEETSIYLWAFGFVASTGLLLVGSSCFRWTG